MERQSGILNPIFSLPSKYGIGDFGKEAKKFIDFLSRAGQKIWQILPLTQTGFGNSPYSSVSVQSFNPYFISLETLFDNGLISKDDLKKSESSTEYIDYDKLFEDRISLLKKAFYKFDKQSDEFIKFKNEGEFSDYALFMAIKQKCCGAAFYDWEDDLKYRNEMTLKRFYEENEKEVDFWLFVQYEAKRQWFELKDYANKSGVSIFGDMPLYVATDSVDVWTNPQLFKLNRDFSPNKVAGVPPDYFSETGQLWGNPVYDYHAHGKDNFSWWTNRIKRALNVFDYVRIDHFRGLDRYYEIEADAATAADGKWITVPSEELFCAVHKLVDKTRIIAEDLGIIDDGVRTLLSKVGYPGMKILQFAFDGNKDNYYLPENINVNSVCYTGTHDNDTLIGYLTSLALDEYEKIKEGVSDSLKLMKIKKRIAGVKSLASAIIELGFKCKSKLFIIPIFDILYKDSKYRINEPGTVKKQNWAVKTDKGFYTDAVCKRLRTLSEEYGRI